MNKIQNALLSRPILSASLAFFLATAIVLPSWALFAFEAGNSDISIGDAFFTLASAATVTGLTVEATNAFSLASKLLILVVIQVGGLMAIIAGASILIIVGRRGRAAAGIVSQLKWNEVKEVACLAAVFALFVEGISAFALYYFSFRETAPDYAALNSIFLAVSAFSNAGFYLFSDDLRSYSSNPVVLGILMFNIIAGGLGFVVILDIKQKIWAFLKRENAPFFRLQSRIVLTGTAILLLLGFVGFLGLERDGVLAGRPLGESALVSVFESVSARTAGFSAVSLSGIKNATQAMLMLLMFVGAGAGSTSGGVRITTAAIVSLTIISFLRGKRQVIVWGSEITRDNIWRATGTILIYGFTLFFTIFLIMIIEGDKLAFKDIMFESFSASGTVGFSVGITSKFSEASKLLLVALMVLGRLGPLGLTYMLTRETMEGAIDPNTFKEEVAVG